jgi:hypothetical protein
MIPVLTEIGRGMGWLPWQAIAMLWGYFDESGEHPAGGNLTRLTFGGGFAPFEAWEALSMEWAAALELAGIHYVSYGGLRGPPPAL